MLKLVHVSNITETSVKEKLIDIKLESCFLDKLLHVCTLKLFQISDIPETATNSEWQISEVHYSNSHSTYFQAEDIALLKFN